MLTTLLVMRNLKYAFRILKGMGSCSTSDESEGASKGCKSGRPGCKWGE